MPVISYMGTKAALSQEIAANFRPLPAGPLLDLFAGMATVGRTVAPTRNVWLNDVQQFSRTTSEVQFLNCNGAMIKLSALLTANRVYRSHYATLADEYCDLLCSEDIALKAKAWDVLAASESEIRTYIASADGIGTDTSGVANRRYNLFCSTFAAAYFGLRQCIQIDAIRKGIDEAAPADQEQSAGLRRWMLAALGGAVSRCSNSTGHFAQYLTLSEGNFARVASQRRRDIYAEWAIRLRENVQVGNYKWRRNNRIFNADACELLTELRQTDMRPAVIYADPPYTSDQYSRYYHVLETLIRYDYPKATGKGLYREDRFVSNWSLKTKVLESFQSLIEQASELKAALVISYPANGLLPDSEQAIPRILREHYRHVSRKLPVAHQHSTMGGSKGAQRHSVIEQIFVAS